MVFSGQLHNSHRVGYCQRSPERKGGRELAIRFFKNAAEAV